jgi:biopolymer transport protein ExbB/TolQ
MMNWLIVAAVLEWTVLISLLISSVWSIAIMIDRRRVLQTGGEAAGLEQAKALIATSVQTSNWQPLQAWVQKDQGIIAGTLLVVHETVSNLSTHTNGSAVESRNETVDRAVRSYLTEKRMQLEKGLPVLATLGANAPFIGLFGTVLGIIRAFAALADSSGAATTVMTGISQALYATAAGLFVAIPAVIAFNHFSNQLRRRLSACEAMKDLYLSNAQSQAQVAPVRGT